jgi:D-alanyl-D-alanine carboxypeptidase (penicillin-binding protein 5/6)|tara:strand:- start:11762 stop:12916 length:1155 start_codon:yes stop_codon:yes gene_type:complete
MKKLLLLSLSISFLLDAQSFIPDPPDLDLKSYILIEPNTNTVIAEFNSDFEIVPASMTKIMTVFIAAEYLADGAISLEDETLVSTKAWKMTGSRMFIEQGKKVKILDLLKGIVIHSGNDASVALAEFLGGDEEGFVDLMNSYAADLGMYDTNFFDASGLSDLNTTTARDLSILTSNFINKFPETYALYKEKSFTYNNIKQLNRNKLLWRDDTSDGMKTGWTESAGYCLVGSAKRGEMRLITVVAGSRTENDRFLASQRLLEYGFKWYVTQKVIDANKEYQNIKIWGGQEKTLSLGFANDISITLPRKDFKDLKINYKYKNNIQAPISVGQKIGILEISSNDEIVLVTDLVALQDIEAKGFFGRLWSKFVLWIFSLFGMAENGSD